MRGWPQIVWSTALPCALRRSPAHGAGHKGVGGPAIWKTGWNDQGRLTAAAWPADAGLPLPFGQSGAASHPPISHRLMGEHEPNGFCWAKAPLARPRSRTSPCRMFGSLMTPYGESGRCRRCLFGRFARCSRIGGGRPYDSAGHPPTRCLEAGVLGGEGVPRNRPLRSARGMCADRLNGRGGGAPRGLLRTVAWRSRQAGRVRLGLLFIYVCADIYARYS